MSFSTLKSKSISDLRQITTKTIIQMNDVWASYDAKNYAVKEINLSIDRGTNYAIVGQSGSGKSTLLKLINGMMIPSKGQVKFDYQTPNVNNKNFKKSMSKIGYIPQNLGLVKNISVLDNILIGALPRIGKFKSFFKIYPDEEIQEAEKIIKLVGLNGKSERKAYMLSGGEKRRVAIMNGSERMLRDILPRLRRVRGEDHPLGLETAPGFSSS